MNYQEYVRAYLLHECYNTLNANNTENKILDFEDIEDGWHFGEGIAVSRRAIQDACRLHDTFLEYGFYETDAFPGLAGEVRVTAYWKDYYFEFTRERDGRWRFIEEVNGSEIEDAERDNLSLSETQKTVEEIAQRLWTTFATSQETTGMPNCNDFKAWLLKSPQMAESPSLSTIASCCITGPSANTYGFFIPQPENHQFSGDFRMPYYQMEPPLLPLLQTPAIRAIETLKEFRTESLNAYLKPIVGSPKTANPWTLKYVGRTFQEPSHVQTFPDDSRLLGQAQTSFWYPTSSLQSAEAICR